MRSLGLRAIALSAILGAVGLAHNASATPVTMNYCVQVESGGLYLYTITMTLDNHDNSWTPGYGSAGSSSPTRPTRADRR